MGILTLLGGIVVFLVGVFFTIWGLAYSEFQGGFDFTQNSALPTGVVVLFAAIMILRKYSKEKNQ